MPRLTEVMNIIRELSTRMNGVEISPFIAALTKVELQVHIEGTLTPALRRKLAHRNGIPLPYATYEVPLNPYKVTYNHRRELDDDNGAPTFLEEYRPRLC
ncbi:hypothetical protein MAP00_003384 [Monascus purpureus]|nr:hypothetical protein MAP00_003384 [Monascus purpureus]